MSRNIDKANELLFDLIKIRFDQVKISNEIDLFNRKRWIYGDASDKDWLVNCKIIDYHEISINIRYGILKYSNDYYYFVTGLKQAQNLPPGLYEEPLNPGIFLAIASEIELPLLEPINLMQIENDILYQHENSDKYNGHVFSDLIPFFSNIFILKVTAEYPGDSTNSHQFFAMLLSCNPDYLYLKFEKNALENIFELSLVNSNILAYENIIHALLSSHYKYTFLDLYRCIEQLYQIVYIETAFTKLGLDQTGIVTKTGFLEVIDLHLSWKPQERSTLEKIFSLTPEINKQKIFYCYNTISSSKDQNVSNKLYELRCNIVHLKSSQKNITYNSKEWAGIISGICNILTFWYSKYNNFV